MPRVCMAVVAFRKTGRVAFPEKVAEAAKREADAKRQRDRQKAVDRSAKERDRKPTKPTAGPPAARGESKNLIAVVWRRYWKCVGKYAVFDGRSDRADLGSFVAGTLVGFIVLSAFNLGPFLLFATAIPAWALAVRRLHDANISGKWLWLSVLWPIAVVVLPVMLLQPGTSGPNPYGPRPD